MNAYHYFDYHVSEGYSKLNASAAYGFATTTLSAFLGGLIGRAYDGTTLPLMLGFVGLGFTCLLIVTITERGRLFQGR